MPIILLGWVANYGLVSPPGFGATAPFHYLRK